MKKLISLLSIMFVLLPLFAADKTADEWKKEVEMKTGGSLEWNNTDCLKNAKKFVGVETFSLAIASDKGANIVIAPADLNNNTSNKLHFAYLEKDDVGYMLGQKTISVLNEGDLFFTFSGGLDNTKSDLWLLNKKISYENAVKMDENGNISFNTASTKKAINSKYKEPYKKTDDTGYLSDFNLKKGIFNFLILNFQDGTIYEYELHHVGIKEGLRCVESAKKKAIRDAELKAKKEKEEAEKKALEESLKIYPTRTNPYLNAFEELNKFYYKNFPDVVSHESFTDRNSIELRKSADNKYCLVVDVDGLDSIFFDNIFFIQGSEENIMLAYDYLKNLGDTSIFYEENKQYAEEWKINEKAVGVASARGFQPSEIHFDAINLSWTISSDEYCLLK